MGKDGELIEAGRNGDVAAIEKLLGNRNKPRKISGFAPLGFSFSSLRRAVNTNAQNDQGDTSLHLAALNGHLEAVRTLLKYDASANLMDASGCFPLHLAAWSGNAEICRTLLTQGPSLAKVNEQGSSIAIEPIAMPSLVEFGKIYGTGGGMTDENVVGYSAMVATNGARMNVSWARAVRTPRSDQYTYQPLSGAEPNISITVDHDQEFEVFDTNLNFNKSVYNDLEKVKFVLRLSIDSERGPVDVHVFLHNDDMYQEMSLARVELPETATHIVPDRRAGVNVSHEVQITVPNLELDVRPTFARVFEQEHENSDMAGPRDFWVVIPKNPDAAQRRYRDVKRGHEGESTVVKQTFLAADAFKNDSGLYQFDTMVVSSNGPLYQITVPFLLRQQNYTHHYQGILPCSPYRRDMKDKWLRGLGFVEGDLPCARFIVLDDKFEKAEIRFNFIKRDPYMQIKHAVLNNDRPGLNVVKDRFYVVNNPDRYLPWFDEDDDDRNDVAVVHQIGYRSDGHRQTSFRFRDYRPIEFVNVTAVEENNGATVKYNCSATWTRHLKVARVSESFYQVLRRGMSQVNSWDLKYLSAIRRSNYRYGIQSVDREGGDRNGDRLYSIIIKFSKNRMNKLYANGDIVVCLAYNEMDLRVRLLSDDYPLEL